MPYIVRDTNNDLWKKFRERAEKEGRALKWILEELIRYYVKHGLPK